MAAEVIGAGVRETCHALPHTTAVGEIRVPIFPARLDPFQPRDEMPGAVVAPVGFHPMLTCRRLKDVVVRAVAAALAQDGEILSEGSEQRCDPVCFGLRAVNDLV